MGCAVSKPSVSDSTTPVVVVPTGEVDFKPIHSAIRWNKPVSEILPLLSSQAAVDCVDPGNGNRGIHIAAQNGHLELVKMLINKKAELNAKNSKGNTAIHMAIGYDYYLCAIALINAGGDQALVNDAGFPGTRGLEGDKCMGIAALCSATNATEAILALDLCAVDPTVVAKVTYVSSGLRLKKSLGKEWSPALQDKFKAVLANLT